MIIIITIIHIYIRNHAFPIHMPTKKTPLKSSIAGKPKPRRLPDEAARSGAFFWQQIARETLQKAHKAVC